MAKTKKYDTKAKRIAFVRRKGSILTFKKPIRWMGESFSQILSYGIEKDRGFVKIVGFGKDTPWFKNMDALISAIDWKKMERWHGSDLSRIIKHESPREESKILSPNLNEFVSFVEKDLRIGYRHNKRSIEALAHSLKISDRTEIKELTELAIVNVAREIALGSGTTWEKYQRIVKLYNDQVTLSHRTSQSILLQQYSTPAPIAFLMGVFCGLPLLQKKEAYGFEPSAGNGLFTNAAQP